MDFLEKVEAVIVMLTLHEICGHGSENVQNLDIHKYYSGIAGVDKRDSYGKLRVDIT